MQELFDWRSSSYYYIILYSSLKAQTYVFISGAAPQSFRCPGVSLMTAWWIWWMCSWQSSMTWRCVRLWTVVPSGGLPAAAAPPSLKPPPRVTTRLSSASWRTFAPSWPALRQWSAGSRAGFAPSPPPATTDPPHLARSTGPSRRLRPPRAGRRTTRAGSRLTEVLWLHPVTLTQTRACGSWCPAWTRWRTSWGKEAKSLSARTESQPPGRGERQEVSWNLSFQKLFQVFMKYSRM